MVGVRAGSNGGSGWLALLTLSLMLSGLVGQQQFRPAAARADARPATVADLAVRNPSPVDPPLGTVAPVAATPRVQPAAAVRPATPARHATAPAASTRRPAGAAAGADVCSGPGWQQRRGAAALRSLQHPIPAGVSVSFAAARSGFLGLTYPAQHHVDLFVRSCDAESWTLLRHVAAHEMGHAYDAAHMTADRRAAYLAMRGIPAGTPWFGCSYCTDFATPAGDFAETYAQWQRGASDSRTQLASVPGPAALARIGATFFTG